VTGGVEFAPGGLEFARRLAELGVPVFSAPPGKDRRNEFFFPPRWQNTPSGAGSIHTVNEWENGHMLGAVMGVVFDAFDIDPRHGGSEDLLMHELESAGLEMPRVYARVATPSGGLHLYIARLSLAKVVPLLPGVDYIAGDDSGEGRGFLYLPPTMRLPKLERAAMRRPGDPPGRRTMATREKAGYVIESELPWKPAPPVAVEAAAREALRAFIVFRAAQNTARASGGGDGSPHGYCDPDLEALAEDGIPDGRQEPTLRDVVWKCRVVLHMGRDEAWSWFDRICSRSVQDPEWPWSEDDFGGFWERVQKKAAVIDREREEQLQWAVNLAANGYGNGSSNGVHHNEVKEAQKPVMPVALPEWIDRSTVSRLRTQEWYRDAKAAANFRMPGEGCHFDSLADDLATPGETVRWLIDTLVGASHNVLLAALYKAGKTTLLSNLAAALASGTSFLGRAVTAPAGRIAYWNMEVARTDWDEEYARPLGMARDDMLKIKTAHLRDFAIPCLSPGPAREWALERLDGVGVWIIDPWARLCAWHGVDPLDNGSVAELTAKLDALKEEAGIKCVIIAAHTPHAARADPEMERALGAQAASAWADSLMVLTMDAERTRYLRATGRGVDFEETALEMVPGTSRLLAGNGTRGELAEQRLAFTITQYVRHNHGCSQNDIRAAVGGRPGIVVAAINALASEGVIRIEREGNAHRHYYAADS
jgi:AAA domain-containing protein